MFNSDHSLKMTVSKTIMMEVQSNFPKLNISTTRISKGDLALGLKFTR